MKEIFPDLRPASYVEISVVGDKLSLEWPSNSGWEVISDRDPCMVCVCVQYQCKLYFTTDMHKHTHILLTAHQNCVGI